MKDYMRKSKLFNGLEHTTKDGAAYMFYEDVYNNADDIIKERMKRLQTRRWRKLKRREV
jgi:hypothetical protein